MEQTTQGGVARFGAAAAVIGILIAVFGQALAFVDRWPGSTSVAHVLVLGCGAAIAAAGGAALALSRRAGTSWVAADWAVAAYVGWTAVATAFSVEPLLSISGMRGFWDGLAGTLAAGCCYAAARLAVGGRADAGRLAKRLAVAAGAVVLVLGVAGLAGAIGVGGAERLWMQGRLGSLLVQPTVLAGLVVTWLPLIAAAGAALALRRPMPAMGVTMLAAAAAGALTLVATGSRSGWLATAFAAVAYAWLSAPDRRSSWRRVAVAASVAAIALGGVAVFRGVPGEGLGTRVQRTFGDAAFAPRVGGWRIALEAAASDPLTGTGPGTFAYSHRRLLGEREFAAEGGGVMADAHNWYLNSAATAGWPAALAAAAIALFACRRMWLSRGAARVELAAATGAAAYAVHCLATPNAPETFVGALVLLGVAESAAAGGAATRARWARPALAALLAFVGAGVAVWGARSFAAEATFGPAALRFDVAGMTRASEIAPEVAEYPRRRALTLLASGGAAGTQWFDSALGAIRHLAADHPLDADALSTAGAGYLRLSQVAEAGGDAEGSRALADEALATLEAAGALAPRDPAIRERLDAAAERVSALGR